MLWCCAQDPNCKKKSKETTTNKRRSARPYTGAHQTVQTALHVMQQGPKPKTDRAETT